MKIISQKLINIVASTAVATSMVFIPTLASANNGIGLGLGVHGDVDSIVNTDSSVHAETHANGHDRNGSLGSSFKIDSGVFGSVASSTATNFKASVKTANDSFKTAKRNAHATFKAALQVATDQAQRTAALKVYFSNLLNAFKTRSASIEAAFQAFISAN